ncbi:MAG: hypothetical protein NZ524_04200 [Thiobacillaceae bacterium]|nr:hypothetical protein [Thiobacillaceae bacterium]MCX7672723.1 hypothetical protein [Thiobacillaceae bacterium]MDW8324443.1 hypothetical protein [Burkholderiales bacterium]
MHKATTTPPEVLLSALLFLLSRYGHQPCPGLALSIVEHLRLIAADERQPEGLRRTARGLMKSWQWRLGMAGGPLH